METHPHQHALTTEAIDTRIDFINNLELERPRIRRMPAIAMRDAGNAAYVDAGSLISFVAGIDVAFQKDVLNSVLLAQLAANRRYDREADARSWYGFYRTVLENVGWVIQGFAFTEFNVSGGSFSCDRAVIEVLAAIATGGEMAIVRATLTALKNLSDSDGRIVLFEHSSHNLHQANFQIGSVQQTNGIIAMSLGAFEFSASQDITRVLFFSWESAHSHLYKSAQNMTLNEGVYDRVRQAVIDKLGDAAERFVSGLQI